MHIAQNWRLNNQRLTLNGLKCEKCGHVQFPPRENCPVCQREDLERAQAEQRNSYAAIAESFAFTSQVQPNEVSMAAR